MWDRVSSLSCWRLSGSPTKLCSGCLGVSVVVCVAYAANYRTLPIIWRAIPIIGRAHNVRRKHIVYGRLLSCSAGL